MMRSFRDSNFSINASKFIVVMSLINDTINNQIECSATRNSRFLVELWLFEPHATFFEASFNASISPLRLHSHCCNKTICIRSNRSRVAIMIRIINYYYVSTLLFFGCAVSISNSTKDNRNGILSHLTFENFEGENVWR
jgi:hypothetical protein